ncbi:hypothetical protein D0817_05310 [Flavobacterium cupreum]|uniref:Uncharacterized protein n=1 Tax=Flavobacterium cupreum TaxID=2133766 RepID=A0A434AB33_9FLAO|nr:hypothetical protein D0817_05310 [Flavobacterium cupreum]
MKKYTSYKRIDPVYFSGEIFFPIGLLAVAACITYGLLYFLGIGLALFFNVVIAWIANFFMYYYGKSSANITFEFLAGVVGVLALLLFVDYGVYALVAYQKTGVFQGWYFTVWFSIVFGSPVGYYVYKFSSNYQARIRLAKTYFKASFGVYHDRELLTYIDSIAFVNTSKKLASDIELLNDISFFSEQELEEMEPTAKYYHLQQSAFSCLIHIPFGADRFEMSWYSIIEDQYYTLNIPFPYAELLLEQEKYPLDEPEVLRGKKSKRIQLHLYPNGGLKLYTEDLVLLDFPESTPTQISPEQKEDKIQKHRRAHRYYADEKAFSELIEKIKTSGGIRERFGLKDKLISWNLTFSGLDERNYIEITDVSFKNYRIEKDATEMPDLRFLPKKITFIYRGSSLFPWLHVYVDSQQLNRTIEENKGDNEETSVILALDFHNESEVEMVFTVVLNGKKIRFTHWEIGIDERWKKEIDEEKADKAEDDLKRKLLKEGWDFVFAKDYEAAQKKCDELLEIDPQFGFTYFLEARLLWYTKGFEACYAQRDYFIAKTAHEPAALAHIYNSFGCILDLELRYEESLVYFEKAIATNPKEPVYVCNLGEIYYKMQNPKKAMEQARKAKTMGYASAMLTEIMENKGKIALKPEIKLS